MNDSVRERLLGRIDMGTPQVCWPWNAGCNSAGYGALNVGGSMRVASRLAWEEAFGEIPEGLSVLHHCDNPPCCNPWHLFIGTHADNMRDMREKGRGRSGGFTGMEWKERWGNRASRCGEAHHKAKLTTEQVVEIRQRYAAGGVSQAALGREFEMHQTTISSIVRHEYWRDA